MGRSMFGENYKPTLLKDGASGTVEFTTDYVSAQGFGEVAFVCVQDDPATAAVVVQVMERKPNGSDAQALTSYTGTLSATDDGKFGIICVDTQFLTAGYSDLALKVTPAGDENITLIALQGDAVNRPVSRIDLAFYVDVATVQ